MNFDVETISYILISGLLITLLYLIIIEPLIKHCYKKASKLADSLNYSKILEVQMLQLAEIQLRTLHLQNLIESLDKNMKKNTKFTK